MKREKNKRIRLGFQPGSGGSFHAAFRVYIVLRNPGSLGIGQSLKKNIKQFTHNKF